MRILHTVETYNPFTSGMQEVVQRISELLIQRGHQVTVATTAMPERNFTTLHGVHVRQFDIRGNWAAGYRGKKSDVEAYQQLLLSNQFDIITGFAAQQWSVDLMLPILHKIPAATVFVPTGFSGLYWRGFKEYYKKMPEWLRTFNTNIVITKHYRDAAYVQEHGILNVHYIPNGASTSEFSTPQNVNFREQFNIPREHLLFLHVGSHTGVKGHAEMIKAFKRAKIPPATLLIIGTQPQNGCAQRCQQAANKRSLYSLFHHQSSKNTRLVTLERPETVAAFHAADVFLFLSNIECSPIVLFESMATNTPFISTDVGNAVEVAQEGSGTGLLVKTRVNRKGMSYAELKSSIGVIEQLGNNMALREKLGAEGHRVWKKIYTWEGIAGEYEKLYSQLVQRKEHTT